MKHWYLLVIVKSDTPSEGSESAGDEVTRSGNEVKRNRSLRMLRRRKIDGPNGEDETNFFERFKNSVTTVDPEKQRRKSMRRKQKEEVSILMCLYTICKWPSYSFLLAMWAHIQIASLNINKVA